MTRRTTLRLLLALTVPAAVSFQAFSELSIQPTPSGAMQIIHIFGKGEGPDPFPQFGLVLPTNPLLAVNPNGDVNGDRSPDFIWRLGSRPVVVWALQDGQDFEIAASDWDGTSWSGTTLLTNNAVADLDPRLSLDPAGLPIVTWWRDGASGSSVRSSRRSTDGTWEPESVVSTGAQQARMPAVAVAAGDGKTRVSYEVVTGSLRQIVVARDDRTTPAGPSIWVTEVIAQTTWSGQTAPIVETRGGSTWANWVNDGTHVGWSELTGGVWTLPAFEPYSGPEDIEAARFRIKNRLAS